jgi:hypothetical protein
MKDIQLSQNGLEFEGKPIMSILGPYSQHFIFFIFFMIYDFAQKARVFFSGQPFLFSVM